MPQDSLVPKLKFVQGGTNAKPETVMVHLEKLNLRNMYLNYFTFILWVSHFHIHKTINYYATYFYNITAKYSFTSNYSVHNKNAP